MTVIIFLIVLAVLIFVHELGHFLAARACGIRVDAFALGFGPKLFSWKRGETTYALNIIPFGGYVKIFGENPDSESILGPDSARSFSNKPRWQQAIVLAAGVFFNFIFALILYIIIFSVGITATITGFERYADRFDNERIMITHVAPDSPAAKSGLEIGDIITNIEGLTVEESRGPGGYTVAEIQHDIDASHGDTLMIRYLRDETAGVVTVSAIQGIVDDRYAIGIAMDTVGDLRLPVFSAIAEGTKYTGNMTKATTIGLYTFFSNIFKGEANFDDVAGPIGIAGIIGSAANLGISYLLMITALISINLGIINLIPFPALDGGRLLFVAIESVIQRRIPMSFANAANAVGFILLMLLMVIVTYKDIARLLV